MDAILVLKFLAVVAAILAVTFSVLLIAYGVKSDRNENKSSITYIISYKKGGRFQEAINYILSISNEKTTPAKILRTDAEIADSIEYDPDDLEDEDNLILFRDLSSKLHEGYVIVEKTVFDEDADIDIGFSALQGKDRDFSFVAL